MNVDLIPKTKWISLKDAIRLIEPLCGESAKDEFCDLANERLLTVRGIGTFGYGTSRYVQLGKMSGTDRKPWDHYEQHLIPEEVDWENSSLGNQHVSLAKLEVLNNETFRALVIGERIPNRTKSSAADFSQSIGRKGGRPKEFDWDEIWIEICRHIHDKGVPKTQAELVRAVQKICELRFEHQPSDSTLKPKIRRLFEVLGLDEN